MAVDEDPRPDSGGNEETLTAPAGRRHEGGRSVAELCRIVINGPIDPAVIAYRAFDAAEAAIASFCQRDKHGDIPGELADARFAACTALMATSATTAEGVAAKLRASVSVYEGSEIEDEALTVPLADLQHMTAHIQPTIGVPQPESLVSAMANRMADALAIGMKDDQSPVWSEVFAILEAANYSPPVSLSDAAFLLVLCTHQTNYLTDFEHDNESIKEIADTVRRILYPAVEIICRSGAHVRPEVRNYFQPPYMDPRLPHRERDRLRDADPGPAHVAAE